MMNKAPAGTMSVPLSGQNERSTPVVMQNAGEHISVVWPTNIQTQDPVFPLPKSSAPWQRRTRCGSGCAASCRGDRMTGAAR